MRVGGMPRAPAPNGIQASFISFVGDSHLEGSNLVSRYPLVLDHGVGA
jgi:hypothetical protein